MWRDSADPTTRDSSLLLRVVRTSIGSARAALREPRLSTDTRTTGSQSQNRAHRRWWPNATPASLSGLPSSVDRPHTRHRNLSSVPPSVCLVARLRAADPPLTSRARPVARFRAQSVFAVDVPPPPGRSGFTAVDQSVGLRVHADLLPRRAEAMDSVGQSNNRLQARR